MVTLKLTLNDMWTGLRGGTRTPGGVSWFVEVDVPWNQMQDLQTSWGNTHDVIVAGIFGHEHTDNFRIIYDGKR